MVDLDKGLENFYFGMTIRLGIWRGFKLWFEREVMTKIRRDCRFKKRELTSGPGAEIPGKEERGST